MCNGLPGCSAGQDNREHQGERHSEVQGRHGEMCRQLCGHSYSTASLTRKEVTARTNKGEIRLNLKLLLTRVLIRPYKSVLTLKTFLFKDVYVYMRL